MQSVSQIDLATLSDETLRALADGIVREQWQRALSEREDKWTPLLRDGTDAEIIAAANAEYPDAPITLADRYERIHWKQETNLCSHHPRRPVFLKGAKNILIRTFCRTDGGTSANGWAARVLARAVRMSKATILDRDEYEAFITPVIARMHRRYRLTSSFDDLRHRVGGAWWRDTVLIGGRFVNLNASELANVKALHAIIRKTDKLDRRAEMARRHMNERLAA